MSDRVAHRTFKPCHDQWPAACIPQEITQEWRW